MHLPSTAGSAMTSRFGHIFGIKLLASLLVGSLYACPVHAWERDDRLVIMAADLLPAVVSAQIDAEDFYRVDGQQQMGRTIPVCLLYNKKKYIAERVAKRLNKITPLPNHSFLLHSASVRQFLDNTGDTVCQKLSKRPRILFLVDDLKRLKREVIQTGLKHNALIYSYSFADVEDGATAGIRVTERVLPALNMTSLKKIGISFAPLFVRIAEKVNDE